MGRKIRIFSLGQKNNILIKQKRVYADFDFHCLSFHLQSECLCKTRLRVVPLSLTLSCVMRLVRRAWQIMAARDPEGEKCFSPPGFLVAIIFFCITHDELSERGTTDSLVQNVSHENH